MINKGIELKELHVADYTVRKRDSGDLSEWFRSINSVIYPTSLKAKVARNGKWENCVVSAQVSYDNREKLQMNLYFDDATYLSVCEYKIAYLPESYKMMAVERKRAG